MAPILHGGDLASESTHVGLDAFSRMSVKEHSKEKLVNHMLRKYCDRQRRKVNLQQASSRPGGKHRPFVEFGQFS